ncbi:BUB1B kinase, partial [Grantiella picta]|nr:BUB1B kinase [Grantiella picta]
TPCKIEPSINCVLSTRKHKEQEDPLQRVQDQQQDNQEKTEVVMYCKEKVYAGVDEFSFEEIRAEVYRKKARKKEEGMFQSGLKQVRLLRWSYEVVFASVSYCSCISFFSWNSCLTVLLDRDSYIFNSFTWRLWNRERPPDQLNGIECSTEDAIVTGSYKNNSLCANPEDTCDFNRAAHLASTPFHGVAAQRVPTPACPQSELEKDSPESKSAPLNQETPVCEEAYTEALHIKKLSPIMEASLEDTRSSGSSVSAGSLSSVTQMSTNKYLQITEKLELSQGLLAEVVTHSQGDDVAPFLWSTEQRKKLLGSMLASLTASPDTHSETGTLPCVEVGKDIELGNETYCIKMEYCNNEEYKMFFAIPAECTFPEDAKGFAIKVYSEPVPWDFYFTHELQKRLNSDFDQSFSENCSCYLYQDGCAIVHKDTNCFTLRDILRDRKFITKELIFVVVHDLLHVVEKLHKAEIVHGDLRPEMLFLGDRFVSSYEYMGGYRTLSYAVKMVDFSHSLDLKLLPGVSVPYSFPTAHTPHGQQLLAEDFLPYRVDLVGIADVVHLMLFGDHIQIYQENSTWKISQNLSKTPGSDFWSKLFEKILNADGKSTVPLLKELREEINEMFDNSFQERL